MVEFRSANPEDALGLSRCVDAVARERLYLAVVTGFPEDQTRTFVRNLLDNGGVYILALDEGTVIGWCDVMPQLYEGMRHVGRLGMGLLSAYRRQGFGKRLLQETVGRAFAKGLRRIELEVFASNLAAQRLYMRAGFVTEGRKRRARILDGVEDDILVMGLLREEWIMAATITRERPDSADATALISELEAHLDPLYPAKSRHGYSIEKLISQGVAFFVLRADGVAAGCGGIQLFGSDYGELKRMYVRPQFRGFHYGEMLLHHLADFARAHGIGLLRLETGIHQAAAIRLYERAGFQRIPPFRDYVPDPLSLFYEKRIL